MEKAKTGRLWAVQALTDVGWAWQMSPMTFQYSIFAKKRLALDKARDIRQWNGHRESIIRVVEITKLEAQP